MKAILITTNDEVSIVDLQADHQPLHEVICKTIGAGIYQIVRPIGLPVDIVMCVDEEGLLRKLPLNSYGCYLYGTHLHGQPIVGDLLIAKEGWTPDGMGLVEMTEDELKEQYDLARAFTTHIKNFDNGMGCNV